MIQIDKDKLNSDMMWLSLDAVGAIMNGEHERAEYYSRLLSWLNMLYEIIRAEEQKNGD